MSFPVADELLKARNHVPQHLSNPVKMHLRCVCVGILECEVKWALGSITMNKASGGDGIPVELFQAL